MNNNISKEQLEIKEKIGRIVDIFNYRYIKANTKSKKRLIASDLLLLSSICEKYFPYFEFDISWNNDDTLYKDTVLSYCKYVMNIVSNQEKYLRIFKSSSKQILSTNPNVYKYYGKDYPIHALNDLEEVFYDFLNTFSPKLCNEYKNMEEKGNIFLVPVEDYDGQNYSFSILNDTMIFLDQTLNDSVELYGILSHELGHSYEANLYWQNHKIREYDKTINSPFYEVSSSFLEYAYINYLIENNIYKEEGHMLLHDYIMSHLIHSIYSVAICRIPNITGNVDEEMMINIEKNKYYLESLQKDYNIHITPSNNKLSLRDSFIYGFGQLFSIYMYENYKKDPKYFLKEFDKALLDYSFTEDMSSFKRVGVSYDDLVKGDTLKKVLTKNS